MKKLKATISEGKIKVNKKDLEKETFNLRFIARESGITCSLRDREALIEMIWEKAPESYKKNEIKSNSNVYNFMDYERKNKK